MKKLAFFETPSRAWRAWCENPPWGVLQGKRGKWVERSREGSRQSRKARQGGGKKAEGFGVESDGGAVAADNKAKDLLGTEKTAMKLFSATWVNFIRFPQTLNFP
jgi:hypothetical protein